MMFKENIVQNFEEISSIFFILVLYEKFQTI